MRRFIQVLVALGTMLALPSAAAARDGYVTSFDGTKIVYSFFPAYGLKSGQKAPTVMNGPGYASGRSGESDPTVSALLNRGYNVLTWDPRGFGDSGGNVEVDGPDYEVRDASALIDFIARQPEAQLDKPGDPHLGMIGDSYGGGIQNNTAALDPRVDVITPSIAWHSLITSLDKNNTAKGGWGGVLFGLGVEGTTVPGITGGVSGQPAGFQFGRTQDPRTNQALADGAATGEFTPADQAFFASRGPGDLIKRVKIPTLITEGTTDTLFTLHEAIENYEAQRAAGANVAMIWFCGGLNQMSIDHGLCFDSQGPDPNIVLDASVQWLDRYLKGQRGVRTGPRFQWVSDKGSLYGANDYPLPQDKPITASGSGTLPLLAGDSSGTLIAAGRATNALNIALNKPPAGSHLLGEPTLTITYSGTAPSSDGRIYAQIVHDQTGRPLGNQVTPIPVTLDDATHTATFTIEGIAADAGGGDTYTLQLTDGTTDYFAARQAGVVKFTSVQLSVPTVAAGAARVIAPPAPQGCPTATGRLHGRRLGAIRLGMTRARAHRAYRFSATRGRRYWDFFCVSRGGIRVAYPSPRLLRTLSPRERRRVRGRVVWALTSNRRYSLRGVHVGARLARVARRLHAGRGYRVGLNTWYITRDGAANGIVKVRHGTIEEIGIVDKRLTRDRRSAALFLRNVY